jgi:hypothetical protein
MRTQHLLHVATFTTLAATLAIIGCGTPGAPQPPSLNLPVPVDDLSASRVGNQIALTWTMPKKNTDKLLLIGNIDVRLCRQQGAAACESTAADLALAPGAVGVFTDTLPTEYDTGAPRPLSYFVELRNHNGRTAGPSNAAFVLAGDAPAPVAGFTAEVHKTGILLRWTNSGASDSSAIRLHRQLLTPSAAKPHEGLLAPQPELLEQNLLVEDSAQSRTSVRGQTLDKGIRFGQTYEYRAQRIARITVYGKTLELAGPLSAPIRIDAQDIFPPEVPTGLAAITTTGENTAASAPQYAIDLSWQPDDDVNLAGYAVYRCEGEAAWKRISSAEPLVAPTFHDTQLQSGHNYRYAVSAIGQNGHESPRSAEAEESVPNP